MNNIPLGTVGNGDGVLIGAVGNGSGVFIGETETASIAYTGELLPAATASYSGISIDPTKRYLKNSGKDKTPALVESGQGKFFNGTSQYINTGIIPNQAQGTLVTRFTYVTGMVNRYPVGKSEAYANGRFGISINASGKLVLSFGSNGNAYEYVPSLINGKSYHVAFKHIGNIAYLYIDGIYVGESLPVTLATHSIPMYIGAFNVSGTASTYFNNIIDETYYYDVALTDAQIETLYKYPEKVKAYNGAIVPDIGSEANCKLFLPMCENSGSNVVNVAVASIEGSYATAIASTDGVGNTVTNVGKIFTVNQIVATTANYKPYISFAQTVGVLYEFEATIKIISGTTKLFQWEIGNIDGSSGSSIAYNTILTAGQVLTISRIGYVRANGGSNLLFDGLNYPTANFTVEFKIRTVTAYTLASYTTAMHTGAAKLSYGAQCTAWKRDRLGVLLGMSNGLSFDGGVSVKPIDTGWFPVASNYILEFVGYFVDDGLKQQDAFGVYDGTNNLQWHYQQFLRRVQGYHGTTFITNANLASWTYSHLVLEHRASTGKLYAYRNGVLITETTTAYAGTLLNSLFIGGNSHKGIPVAHMATIMGTPKIHKGTQYAKFNIAKAWAKAQKTIAKLGA